MTAEGHDVRHIHAAASQAGGDTSFLREIPLPLEEPAPARIGGYRIVRLLGQGGMGRVFEAEQESPRRFVALKVIHPHLVATGRYRRRFAEEVRALGKFSHPAIARILEAGAAPDDRGALRLFCAMELVVGVPLDEHVRHLAPRAIAELMATICDAVHHAHLKGVVHCDLKPENILVDGEGVPRILDFGIARLVGEEAREVTISLGGEGAVVGTLAFASPEQARGDRNAIDVMTDVYGLGATLYTLLAGRPPHDVAGHGPVEAARLIERGSPLSLRAAAATAPLNLHAIVDKASRPRPRDRYASAAAMAADLRRFAAGRPVLARPAPWRELAMGWARRNRLAAALVAAGTVILMASLAAVSAAAVRLGAALELARAEKADREDVQRAIEGSQRPIDSTFRRSTFLAEHLRREEAPGSAARVLAVWDWLPSTPAGQRPGRLLTLDADGLPVDRLDGQRSWPSWARPRFDSGGRFARGVASPRQVLTLAARIADLDGDTRRELVRSIHFESPHLHLSLLEVDEVQSVIRHRGAPSPTAVQLWSHGDVFDVAWDESRGLLWCVVSSSELAWLVPELAAWDSAGCAYGQDDPRILVAVTAATTGGVLPPLRGDAAHPVVIPRWTFALRPPREVRHDATAAESKRPGALPGEPGWHVDRLQIQAFAPDAAGEGRGLGTLYLALRRAETAHDAVGSVALDDAGAPLGALHVESVPPGIDEPERMAALERAQMVDELLRLDLGPVVDAHPIAEELLRIHGWRDPALAALPFAGLSPSRTEAVRRCIEAMTSSWRWLSLSAAELVEDEERVSTLGRLGAPPEEREVAEARLAIDRMIEARRLHASRCPARGNGSCACEWFLESSLALAFAAADCWADCEASARQAVHLHDRHAHLGPGDPVDHALLSIALAVQGRTEEAEEELALAQQALAGATVALTETHQGSAGGLAPLLTIRAARVLEEMAQQAGDR